MGQTVEISLRIPSLRIRRDREGKEELETIANADVRFWKHVEVETIPKPGDVFEAPAASGDAFPCNVIRSEWDENKNMFVVACRYAKTSITAADYQRLINAPDWHVRPLL